LLGPLTSTGFAEGGAGGLVGRCAARPGKLVHRPRGRDWAKRSRPPTCPARARRCGWERHRCCQLLWHGCGSSQRSGLRAPPPSAQNALRRRGNWRLPRVQLIKKEGEIDCWPAPAAAPMGQEPGRGVASDGSGKVGPSEGVLVFGAAAGAGSRPGQRWGSAQRFFPCLPMALPPSADAAANCLQPV